MLIFNNLYRWNRVYTFFLWVTSFLPVFKCNWPHKIMNPWYGDRPRTTLEGADTEETGRKFYWPFRNFKFFALVFQIRWKTFYKRPLTVHIFSHFFDYYIFDFFTFYQWPAMALQTLVECKSNETVRDQTKAKIKRFLCPCIFQFLIPWSLKLLTYH